MTTNAIPARIARTPGGDILLDDQNYTVEEACRFLTAPVTLQIMQKLGKDCSMLCRIRNVEHTLRPTPTKRWPNEKAYPFFIIDEVFRQNPDVQHLIPQGAL